MTTRISAQRERTTRARSHALGPSQVLGTTVMLGIAAKAFAGRLADPDLWWHLRTGQLIVARHAIPAGDPFSFTRPGGRWVVQEWGSEVMLRAIAAIAGLRGIVWWRGLMIVTVYAIVARAIVRDAEGGLGAWTLVGLTAFAGATSWTERPSLFSFLLFVITLHIARAPGRRVFWFIPLAALWANLHGMVLVGLGLVWLLAAVEGIKLVLRDAAADSARARRLALAAAGGTVASLANPYGPALLTHGFHLVRTVSSVVTEWASPDFHSAGAIIFLALVVVTVFALALTPDRVDLTDVVLAGAFLTLGLLAVRNLPISAIVLGEVAARAAPGALRRLRAGMRRASGNATQASPAIGWIALALSVVTLGTLVARGASNAPVSGIYPGSLIERIPAGARLLTRDDWAGYVEFRRWPEVHVAVDTRVDFFGLGIVNQARRAIAAFPGWEGTLDEWCVSHVLLRADDQLTVAIARDPAWGEVGRARVQGGPALLAARRAPSGECSAPARA